MIENKQQNQIQESRWRDAGWQSVGVIIGIIVALIPSLTDFIYKVFPSINNIPRIFIEIMLSIMFIGIAYILISFIRRKIPKELLIEILSCDPLITDNITGTMRAELLVQYKGKSIGDSIHTLHSVRIKISNTSSETITVEDFINRKMATSIKMDFGSDILGIHKIGDFGEIFDTDSTKVTIYPFAIESKETIAFTVLVEKLERDKPKITFAGANKRKNFYPLRFRQINYLEDSYKKVNILNGIFTWFFCLFGVILFILTFLPYEHNISFTFNVFSLFVDISILYIIFLFFIYRRSFGNLTKYLMSFLQK